MTTVTDAQLYEHAARANGKVVIITGAANGIGKETALRFAKHGSKIIIGDLDVAGAEAVVKEIQQAGGQAAAQRCDVTKWDEQVSLFELAKSKFGSVDIVIPNAGVTEIGKFMEPEVNKADGKPIKPNFKTVEINLISVMYTTHIALHYLRQNRTEGDLKSIILLGSMASWEAIPGGSFYSAAKHGVLGLMRSLYKPCTRENIRVGVIHPFFAATAIVPAYVKVALAGVPLTPVERVAGTIFCAATDADMETSGCPWVLLDDGPVLRLERETLKEGVYKIMDERAKRALLGVTAFKQTMRTLRDLRRLLIGKKFVLAVLALIGSRYAYRHVRLS